MPSAICWPLLLTCTLRSDASLSLATACRLQQQLAPSWPQDDILPNFICVIHCCHIGLQMLLVATTWIGAHHTFNKLIDPQAAYPWTSSVRGESEDQWGPWLQEHTPRALRLQGEVAAAAVSQRAHGSSGSWLPAQPNDSLPGPGDASAVVTSGSALDNIFGSLAEGLGAQAAVVSGAAGAVEVDGSHPQAVAPAGVVSLPGAPLPDSDADIELRPEKVQQVVGRAKVAEALQLLQEGPGATGEVRASFDSASKTQVGWTWPFYGVLGAGGAGGA